MEESEKLVVSIIIITCNRPFLLQHCIERVLVQPYPQKELIVVDSSADDKSERVVARYADVRYACLRGQRNNMPQARNTGLALASGDIIAFIDDDSMVQEGWLEELVSVYDDEMVGAAGGRVIGMPAPYCDQITGSPRLFVEASGRVVAKGAGLVSHAQVEVDHLIGCNMSFRRQALEQVGGFDPNYTRTNLREETDMCVRVKEAGWRIVFKPSIAVVHFSARSLQPYFLERPSVQFSNGRNCAYFALKHFGLNPRTLLGQLRDMGRSCARALYFAGLFGIGAAAQLVGRAIGLYEGMRWLLSKRRRALAAPALLSRCRVPVQPPELASSAQK
jgi:GT2 family glycosyltransferase